jgi:hypothetical protein
MPPVSFLNYGLIGLCGLIIWLFWRLFDREQRRAGTPRKQIIHFSWIFIALAMMLAGTGLSLELFRISHDWTQTDSAASQIDDLQGQLATAKTENARLDERVAARDALISRLDKALDHLASDIAALPTSKQTSARVRLPDHIGIGGWTEQTVPVSVSLPENEKLKSQLDGIKALREEVADPK